VLCRASFRAMTPLVLLVGFLGAGKTTFLRSLAPALKDLGLEPHVVINDYGNAKVDASLLEGLAESILPIAGSCVCCGSRDELLDTLRAFDHAAGRVLLLEANGTTDAEELVEMLSLEPDLDRFTLPLQLSVVDATRWQKRFWHNRLESEQVRTATHLHLTRIEKAGPGRVEAVKVSLHQYAPGSAFVDPAGFASVISGVAREFAGAGGRHEVFAPSHGPECGCGGHHHHHDHDHGHAHVEEHHFASVELGLPGVVQRAAFEKFLRALPDGVVRAKGLVRFEGDASRLHVFQRTDQAESVHFIPLEGEARVKEPLALFIGPSLSRAEISASLDACLAAR